MTWLCCGLIWPMPAHPLCPKEDPEPGAWTKRKVDQVGASKQQATRSSCFRFLIQSVYNVLPSPSNLHSWDLLSSPVCQWCREGENAGAQCQSLPEGPRRWEVPVVSAAANNITRQQSPSLLSKQERSHSPIQNPRAGCLHQRETEKELRFLDLIVSTTVTKSRQVVLVELTLPYEERLEEAWERNRALWLTVGEMGGKPSGMKGLWGPVSSSVPGH